MPRDQMFTDLYLARNAAFGINAQTARPIISSRYQDNLQALHFQGEGHRRLADAVLAAVRAD